MPTVPRILRAQPGPPLQRHDPTPVIARLWWRHLATARDAQAWLIATATHPPCAAHPDGPGMAALIHWQPLDLAPRQDWIPTAHIRRPGEPWSGPAHPLPFDSPYTVDPLPIPGPPKPAPLARARR